jgi:hypothetical protein
MTTTQEQRMGLWRSLPEKFLVIEEHIVGFGRGQCSLALENGPSKFDLVRFVDDGDAEVLIDLLKADLLAVRDVEHFYDSKGNRVSLMFYSKQGGVSRETFSANSPFSDLLR